MCTCCSFWTYIHWIRWLHSSICSRASSWSYWWTFDTRAWVRERVYDPNLDLCASRRGQLPSLQISLCSQQRLPSKKIGTRGNYQSDRVLCRSKQVPSSMQVTKLINSHCCWERPILYEGDVFCSLRSRCGKTSTDDIALNDEARKGSICMDCSVQSSAPGSCPSSTCFIWDIGSTRTFVDPTLGIKFWLLSKACVQISIASAASEGGPDIVFRQESGKAIYQSSLLAACPPCQSFSWKKRRPGKNDSKTNDQSLQWLKGIRAIKPLAGVFENIRGMWSCKHKQATLGDGLSVLLCGIKGMWLWWSTKTTSFCPCCNT
jgi:hypothetical protein